MGMYQIDGFYRNKWRYEEYLYNQLYLWVFVTSANAAVDHFLYFSAFFATHKILKFARESHGFGATGMMKIYLNRLSRFIPTYYFVFATGWSLVFWIGKGPMWANYN